MNTLIDLLKYIFYLTFLLRNCVFSCKWFMEMMAPHQSSSKRMTENVWSTCIKGIYLEDACMHVYLKTCTHGWSEH